jgi:hypothetical protein
LRLSKAADLIYAAWRNPLPQLPPELRPGTLAEACNLQHAVGRRLGAIGGWRICRSDPERRYACAPLSILMCWIR